MFDGDKQIEDFMQFRNEFEPHSLDPYYETECSEENFLGEEKPSPELANINLLSRKLKKNRNYCRVRNRGVRNSAL